MMNIVVNGGAGFILSDILQYLPEENKCYYFPDLEEEICDSIVKWNSNDTAGLQKKAKFFFIFGGFHERNS